MKKLFSKFLAFSLLFIAFSCSPTDDLVTSPENTNTKNVEDNLASTAKVITYKVKQYIFQRPAAAFGNGHVGVGYEVRTYSDGAQTNVTYYFGGVENPNGQPTVANGSYNGGWWSTATTGTGMLNIMKNSYGYNNYKFKTAFTAITPAQNTAGYNRLNSFAGRGYGLFGNNCMNASYEVLTDIGTAGVAWPSTNWAPNKWYTDTTSGWSGSTAL